MMLLGRKTSTRRGVIGTSLPVFGLRPTRSPFWRMPNDPNEESFTCSPRAKTFGDLVQNEFNELLRFITRQPDLADHRLGQVGSCKCLASHGFAPPRSHKDFFVC